jgi:uncharacterized iron-regulated membrane protein
VTGSIRSGPSQLRRLHRLAGVWAAAFLAFLAATGMALNHAHLLGLDRAVLRSTLITGVYGMGPRQRPEAYALDEGLFIAGPDRWWISDRSVPAAGADVVGALELGGVIYVATPDAIALYLPDGGLVDRVSADMLPGRPIRRLGRLAERLAIDTPKGVLASADALSWTAPPASEGAPAWATPSSAPPPAAALAELAPGVSAEQLLRDLHSGRIVGPVGPLLVDLTGLVALGLAASGVWLYFRPAAPRRANGGARTFGSR